MNKYLAIFEGGQTLFNKYAYYFEIWDSAKCNEFFKLHYPPGKYYLVIPDGIFYLRGCYDSIDAAKNGVKDYLKPIDDAQFTQVIDYNNQNDISIMNLDF